jgi:hypothetical protein
MTDTLKSICEQSTHLNDPRLDFIPVELSRHREIILRDLKELVSAAYNEAELEKTVTILAGTLLEAVLCGFIQSQQDYIAARRPGGFTFNPEHSLENYVNIFNKWYKNILPNAFLPPWVVEYRDLVHINRELNSPSDVCAYASRDMLRILNTLLGELAQFATPSA